MPEQAEQEAIDPVCGMHLNPFAAPCHVEHGGGRQYFCGEECRDRFQQEPGRFASPAERESAHEEAGEPLATR